MYAPEAHETAPGPDLPSHFEKIRRASMGGLGSSHWTTDVRDTVEIYLALDVNRLNRAGCLKPG